MDQQTFLRLAKRELGVSYRELATEIGVSARTIEKWSLDARSPDSRRMPLIARKFIERLLEERKRARVLAGDRRSAEAVDAIVSHVSSGKFRDLLLTFDTLQRAASVLAPMTVSRHKPGYFESPLEKNAWTEKEELRNARQIAKARASAR